ncbi:trypsin-2-like isoform X2 [Frankliniella occidentalis]|uniref:Trypsin-2-like isoform X2 n=1 Tax=Frankliniella occidentalis TaxID=133901 RepID=A0A6J1S4F0_FRAOC|nr:trypsin-2-like isoform X2 [Frankliniella occidentalis]
MSSEVGVVAALCALLAVFCPEADAITGGSPVPIESFPYQVAIDQFRNQSCGGALIGKKTVITTASCFHRREIDVSDVTVRLGSATRTGGLSLGVDDFLQHPDVDAVLLYLDQRVTPRKEIKFVPVPTVPTAIRQGELVTISGYGDVSDELRAAALLAMDVEVCKDVYFFSVNTRACAGGWTAGMCGLRDVGSPLVNWLGELVGLAVQSHGCGQPGFPTVFADLTGADVLTWIEDNMDMKTDATRAQRLWSA